MNDDIPALLFALSSCSIEGKEAGFWEGEK